MKIIEFLFKTFLFFISISLFLMVIDSNLNVFSDIKNTSVVASLFMSLLLILFFINNRSTIILSQLDTLILLLSLLSGYSSFQKTNTFFNIYTLNIIAYFLFYFTLTNYFVNDLLKARKILRLFCTFFITTTLLSSFYHKYIFLNTGVWGNYLAGVFPILCVGLLEEKGVIYKRIIISYLVLCLICIGFSFARAAWISVMITSLLIAYHLIPRFKVLLNRKNKLILFGLNIAFFTFLIYFKHRSFIGRLLIYKICFNIISSNIFGTGTGTFQSVFHIYQAEYFKNALTTYDDEWFAADSIRIAYNEYLECFIELGVIGFLLISALIYQFIKVYYHKMRFSKDVLALSAIYSLIGFAIVALFSYPLMEKPICSLILINLAYLNAKFDDKIEFKSLFLSKIIWSILLVFCVVTTIKTIKKQVNYFNFSLFADETLKGNFKRENYQLLYPDILDNSRFLYHYGGELMQNSDFDRSIDVLELAKCSTIDEKMLCFLAESYYQKGNYVQAEKNYLLAVYIVPSRFFPKYFLMNFYQKINRISDAKKWANTIINMPIKIESAEVFQIKKEAKQVLESSIKSSENK
jgi:O-antigen polymerase